MMKPLVYVLIYGGSLLMVYNLLQYRRFLAEAQRTGALEKERKKLLPPFVLMALFLAGYLLVGFIGRPDLLVATILFGGSVFVYLVTGGLLFIVQKVQKNEQLQKDLAAAESASAAKTAFLSNMSHDIRTPMNAIIGFTHLARANRDMDTVQGYLEKIEHSSRHLLELINDVLEMSRIESGRLKLHQVSVDLVSVMQDMEEMFALQMAQKAIDFSVDASGIKDRYVLCDKGRLNRILLNLVSNACKFTPEGGRVFVSLSQDADGAAHGSSVNIYYLKVADTGIGMTEEFVARIFEPFEQEKNSTISGVQGTGLGMAITKRIVDMMGGRIEIETGKDKGTTFTVVLPFEVDAGEGEETAQFSGTECDHGAKCGHETQGDHGAERGHEAQGNHGADYGHEAQGNHGADYGHEAQGNHEAERGHKAKGNHDQNKGRLLLVEDMEINREIALALLHNLGYAADVAENGKIAVDKVKESLPGTYRGILMDIQMPVMNGYEAARAIRKLPTPYPGRLPIIAMTANAFAEDVRMAKEAGMNAHVAKPIDAKLLKRTLAEILSGEENTLE